MSKLKNLFLPVVIGVITLTIIAVIILGIGAGDNSDMIHKTFPSVKGIDLLGNKIDIPENLEGDKIILALGFKRKHQKQIDHWQSIIDKSTKENKSIKLYVIPVINKTNFLRRLWINNSMRFATSDKEKRRKVITIYTDKKKFANHLNMELNQAYLVILNNNKNIIKIIEGDPDAKKIKELNNILELKQ